MDFLGSGGDAGIPPPINCNISTGSYTITTGNSKQITGYPNPASNEFIIDFKNRQINNLRTYKIYNSIGVNVSQGVLALNNSINLSALSSGIYLIFIEDSEMNNFLAKVIKL